MRQGLLEIDGVDYICDIGFDHLYLKMEIASVDYLQYCFNNGFDIKVELDGRDIIRNLGGMIVLDSNDKFASISIHYIVDGNNHDWLECGF